MRARRERGIKILLAKPWWKMRAREIRQQGLATRTDRGPFSPLVCVRSTCTQLRAKRKKRDVDSAKKLNKHDRSGLHFAPILLLIGSGFASWESGKTNGSARSPPKVCTPAVPQDGTFYCFHRFISFFKRLFYLRADYGSVKNCSLVCFDRRRVRGRRLSKVENPSTAHESLFQSSFLACKLG